MIVARYILSSVPTTEKFDENGRAIYSPTQTTEVNGNFIAEYKIWDYDARLYKKNVFVNNRPVAGSFKDAIDILSTCD